MGWLNYVNVYNYRGIDLKSVSEVFIPSDNSTGTILKSDLSLNALVHIL